MDHGKLKDRQCVPLVERLEPRLLLNAGDLLGWVATDFGSSLEQAADAVAVQADGKIVVAGFSGEGGSDLDFAIARYNPDGSLDTGFGAGGKLVLDMYGGEDKATSVAIQPDGKILVAGYAYRIYMIRSFDFAVVRLNDNGSLDGSFGTGGKVATDVGGNDYAQSVAIQEDGKIVLAGHKRTSSTSDFAVVRYNTDGSLDGDFGDAGVVTIDLGSNYDVGYDLAIDSAGRIVVVGHTRVGGAPDDFAAARLNADGSLDDGSQYDQDPLDWFGIAGIVTTDFNGSYDHAYAVAIDAADGIVVAGTATVTVPGTPTLTEKDFALARYTSSGALDWKVTTDLGSGVECARSIAISAEGDIVVAGETQQTAGYDFGIAMYNANGSLKTEFAGGTVVSNLSEGQEEYATGVAFDASGNVVVAGYRGPIGSNQDFLLARYEGLVQPSAIIQGMVWDDFNNDGEVNFSEKGIEGVSVTLALADGTQIATVQTDADGMYIFADLAAGTYTLGEAQPEGYLDGIESVGTAGGTAADNQFSDIVVDAGSVAEDYNFGERPEAGGEVTPGQTAEVGFWKNKHGQQVIRNLNGNPDSTLLGDWLAATFPNMYGAYAGANDLTDKTNTEVANFYSELFTRKRPDGIGGPAKLDAHILGTAIATYATNQTLVEVDYDTGDPDAGLVAAVESYGFVVTEYGLGISTFNVGDNGNAFGVDDDTEMTVLDLLLAVNAQTTNGVLYDLDGDGDAEGLEVDLRAMANEVFSAINEAGDS